jgi:hypothetical protein
MTNQSLLHHVARQYQASLGMLGKGIELCPESLWTDEEYPNRFWHIAYHTIFYAHLYLQPSEADFQPWVKHRPDYQYLGKRPGAPQDKPNIETCYSKAEVWEYFEICCEEAKLRVPALDPEAPSGFSWLAFNKMEVQFYNIRHIQHHAGQLADRLRNKCNLGVGWVRPD